VTRISRTDGPTPPRNGLPTRWLIILVLAIAAGIAAGVLGYAVGGPAGALAGGIPTFVAVAGGLHAMVE
jgi:hypothetical protein